MHRTLISCLEITNSPFRYTPLYSFRQPRLNQCLSHSPHCAHASLHRFKSLLHSFTPCWILNTEYFIKNTQQENEKKTRLFLKIISSTDCWTELRTSFIFSFFREFSVFDSCDSWPLVSCWKYALHHLTLLHSFIFRNRSAARCFTRWQAG